MYSKEVMTFSVSVEHSCDCKTCGKTISGTSLKWMYFKMLFHLKFWCTDAIGAPTGDEINLLKTLWQLWRWKAPY